MTTYFDSIDHNLDTLRALPAQLPADWLVSLGVINGRNVWRADLSTWFERLQPLVGQRQRWISSSCSLLHSLIDLSVETRLDD